MLQGAAAVAREDGEVTATALRAQITAMARDSATAAVAAAAGFDVQESGSGFRL